LALLVISCWLLAHRKAARYTIIPALFMFVTTLIALVIQIKKYFITKDYLLFGITCSLLFLAIYLLIETIKALRKNDAGKYHA